MTAKEYIESGAIEAIVMGLADEQEVQLQQAMELMYPEVKEAREAFEESLEQLDRREANQPSEAANQRITAMLQQELEKFRQIHPDTPGSARVVSLVSEPAPKPIKWLRSALAACVLLLMGSILINFYYFSKFADYRTRYNELLTQQNTLLTRQQNLEAQFTVMKDPEIKQVRMNAVAAGAPLLATVYWNTKTAEVYLLMNNMPKPQPGKQYQLWAQVDGKMVDAGVIDPNDQQLALHKMKNFNEAAAFAISLENEGGAPEPTLTAVQVLGKVI